jgi:hypothetical protein
VSTEIMGCVLKVFTGRVQGSQGFANLGMLLWRNGRWLRLGCGGWRRFRRGRSIGGSLRQSQPGDQNCGRKQACNSLMGIHRSEILLVLEHQHADAGC